MSFKIKYKHLNAILLITSILSDVQAAPHAAVVAAGKVQIKNKDTALQIKQLSKKAMIKWENFDIAHNEAVNIVQPSRDSILLNRINSKTPSKIDGSLTANGHVILSNPNGVIFGKTSTIDAAALTATTAHISKKDFEEGNLSFSEPGQAEGLISNHGKITVVEKGRVDLVAPRVDNEGVINAKLGTVNLASGETFTLDLTGEGTIEVAVKSDHLSNQIVKNTGKIKADGGKITLTTAAARSVVDSLIVNTGNIEAKSLDDIQGSITLYAEGSNAVRNNVEELKAKKPGSSGLINNGQIKAPGRKKGATGGKIEILADNIYLEDATVIDASGHSLKDSSASDKNVGGDIKIGGDYLGKGSTPTAMTLSVAAGAQIKNNATDQGNAGRTILWSDGITDFQGQVEAKGGPKVGNGGFLETSGKGYLNAKGNVDLSALNGEKGTYLLDPSDIAVFGNVTPKFQSSAGVPTALQINNLNSGIRLWLDASDSATIIQGYSNAGATVSSQNSPARQITTSASIATQLVVGSQIRLGSDVYTVSVISGTIVTLQQSLTSTYTGQQIQVNRVSAWNDKSGLVTPNNSTQSTASSRPFSGINTKNGLNVLTTNGNQYLDVNLTWLANSGYSFVADIARNSSASTVYYLGNGASGTALQNLHIGWRANTQYTWDQWGSNTCNVTVAGFTSKSHTIASHSFTGTGSNHNAYLSTGETYLMPYTQQMTNAVGGRVGAAYSSTRFNGDMSEITGYNYGISTNDRHLLEQYMSGKWAVSLAPPGTGATENAKATSSTGYSVFSTRYLERLSQTANIALSATNSITLDLKGDTISPAAGASVSFTTSSGNISNVSSGTIATSSGGNISFTAGGSIDLTNLNLNPQGGGKLNLSAGSTINVPSLLNTINLGTISGSSVLIKTSGSNSDITANNTITATTTGTAITLAAAGNFVNTVGSSLFSTPSGRWLIYSTNPANDTLNGLNYNFRAFNSTYGVGPIFPASGNGALYSIQPSLFVTPSATSTTYGTAPNLTGLGYSVSGYLASSNYVSGSDNSLDSISGTTVFTTPYLPANPVGSYPINNSASTLTSALGYGISYNANITGLTVNKAALTVTAVNLSKTYDGNSFFGGSGTIVSGFVNGENEANLIGSISYTGSSQGAVTAGTYTIKPQGYSSNNYAFTYVDGQLAISKAPLTIKARNVSKTYDGLAYSGGGGLWFTGFVPNESASDLNGTLTYDGAAQGAKNVGTYAITPGGYTSSNYTLTYADGILTIGKALLIIVANNQTKAYDKNPYSGGNGVNFSGFVNNESISALTGSLSYTGNSQLATNTGTYAITPTGLMSSNYDINPSDGTLTITPRSLVLLGSKVYDGNTTIQAADLTPQNLIAGDSVTLSGYTATSSKMAATYSSLPTTNLGNTNPNYQLSSPGITAQITQLPLSVSAVAESRDYNGLTTSNALPQVTGTTAANDILDVWQVFDSKTVGSQKTIIPNVSVLDDAGQDMTSNYSIAYQNATGSISVLPVQVSTLIAKNKAYDGTATANFYGTLDAAYIDDDISVQVSGNFNDSNYGSNKPVTLTSLSLAGADASNYILTGTWSTSFNASILGGIFISGIKAKNKGYNATRTALFDLSDVVLSGYNPGEDVQIDSVEGLFATKGIGINKPVTITNINLTGADSSKYVIASYPQGLTANILRALTVAGIVPQNRVYDGTATAYFDTTNAQLNGIFTGDEVYIGSVFGKYVTKHVGLQKSVTITDIILSGHDGYNYGVNPFPTGLSSDITPAPLTLSAQTVNKTYDGTTVSPLNPIATGVIAGDTLTAFQQSYMSKNAGSNALAISSYTLNDGNSGNNYQITTANASGTILRKPLIISATDDTKTYDGTANSSALPTTSALVNGESITNLTQTFAAKDAGTSQLNVSSYSINDDNGGNNYSVNLIPATGTINKTALTVTAQSYSKIYDGIAYTGGNGVTYSGFVPGETESVLSGPLYFSGNSQGAINSGNYAISPRGLNASNYRLYFVNGLLTIQKRPLSITALADSKVYNGTTSSSLMPIITSGTLANNESALLNQRYESKTIGSNKTLIPAISIKNNSQADTTENYTVQSITNHQGTVTPAPLSLPHLIAENKAYDGTDTAYFSGEVLNGVANGDHVNVDSIIGNFDNKNRGFNKPVTIHSISLNGTDKDNYTLTQYPAGLTADVLIGVVIAGVSANNKTYDGTTKAFFTGGTLSGFSVNDDVGVEEIIGDYDTKHWGLQKPITVKKIKLIGVDAFNYIVSPLPQGLTANISHAPLTITAQTDSKVYDGTVNSAKLPLISSGNVAANERATLSQSFSSRHVGNNMTLSSGIAIVDSSDQDTKNNYQITLTPNQTGSITKAPLRISPMPMSKSYDGTNTAAQAGINFENDTTLYGTDSIDTIQVVFDTPTAGSNNKILRITSYIVRDDNNGHNYTVTTTPSQLSTIQPINLTITQIASKTMNNLQPLSPYNATTDVTWQGFVNGETATNLSGVDFDYGSAIVNSANGVGQYQVKVQNIASPNYILSNSASGTLSVTQGIVYIKTDNQTILKDGSPAYNFSYHYKLNNQYVPVSSYPEQWKTTPPTVLSPTRQQLSNPGTYAVNIDLNGLDTTQYLLQQVLPYATVTVLGNDSSIPALLSRSYTALALTTMSENSTLSGLAGTNQKYIFMTGEN